MFKPVNTSLSTKVSKHHVNIHCRSLGIQSKMETWKNIRLFHGRLKWISKTFISNLQFSEERCKLWSLFSVKIYTAFAALYRKDSPQISKTLTPFLTIFYWRVSIDNCLLSYWQPLKSTNSPYSQQRITLLKKRLWHRCFPVNFVKFIKITFLQNTSGRLLLDCESYLTLQPVCWSLNITKNIDSPK